MRAFVSLPTAGCQNPISSSRFPSSLSAGSSAMTARNLSGWTWARSSANCPPTEQPMNAGRSNPSALDSAIGTAIANSAVSLYSCVHHAVDVGGTDLPWNGRS